MLLFIVFIVFIELFISVIIYYLLFIKNNEFYEYFYKRFCKKSFRISYKKQIGDYIRRWFSPSVGFIGIGLRGAIIESDIVLKTIYSFILIISIMFLMFFIKNSLKHNNSFTRRKNKLSEKLQTVQNISIALFSLSLFFGFLSLSNQTFWFLFIAFFTMGVIYNLKIVLRVRNAYRKTEEKKGELE